MKNNLSVTAGQEKPVYIPKEGKHDDAQFISVNGVRLLVKKGETVMLPPAFCEVVEHSDEAKRQAESYINACANG